MLAHGYLTWLCVFAALFGASAIYVAWGIDARRVARVLWGRKRKMKRKRG